MRTSLLVFSILISKLSFAMPRAILITLDGVRWQDTPRLTHLKESLDGMKALFYGDDKEVSVEVSNPQVLSLPAYHSIFLGALSECRHNYWQRVQSETFAERIKRELQLNRSQVAVFASWENLASAVEHQKGTIYVDAGKEDAERKDLETWNLAMRYWTEQKPRFLYVSLNETDVYAHEGQLEKVHASLDWINEVLGILLKALKTDEDTLLIVTTDHGRGNGLDWVRHDAWHPESRKIWLYGQNRALTVPMERSRRHYSHFDIRPTIEAHFGLVPLKGDKRGNVISELIKADQ